MPVVALKGILHPDIVCSADTSDPDVVVVKLEETAATKLKPILLHIPTHDCLVFQLDKPKQKNFKYKSNYISPTTKGLHQGCDYVVACRHNGRVHIVLIELKSNSVSGANSQLWHSTPFVHYLLSLLAIHFPEVIDPRAVDIRYLRFSTSPIDNQKMTTKLKPPTARDPRGFTVFLGGAPSQFYLGNILRA